MSRSTYRDWSELIWFLVSLGILAARVILYAACFLAIHLTVAILSGRSRPQIDADRRSAGPVGAGVLAGAVWASVVTIGAGLLAGGSGAAWLVALAFGAGFGLIVGWQVGWWADAVSWARLPGSMPLGSFSRGIFRVGTPFAITPAERLKHLTVTGPTGAGKTTLLANLALTDILAGAGICLIEVKDNLVDIILGHIPPERERDVIVLDAADRMWQVAFNVLSGVPPERWSLATSELLAVFRRYFADSWGSRLEHILRNVILALLETPRATLADIPRVLLDRAYLEWVLVHVTNPAVRQFFLVEFEQILRRRADALEPILNKVAPWITYPELRNILSRPVSSFDIRECMDRGQILLVRVPQGLLGEDISSLLGGLIVAKIQMAAHSRVDIPPAARRPFFLYVDEFQNFATSSFDRIITEARAFGLGLVCANQYPEQLSRELMRSIEHNVATRAECVRRDGKHFVVVTRLENEDEPFALTPPPPLSPPNRGRAAHVRGMSRDRYGLPLTAERLTVPEVPIMNAPRNGRRAPVIVRRGPDVEEE